MPNVYIEYYENNKLANNTADAIIAALTAIKTDRERRGVRDAHKAGKKIAWSGFKTLFYQVDVTIQNLALIDAINDELNKLPDKNDVNAILAILRAYYKQLSAGGQTRKLTEHIIIDIASEHYNMRRSSVILHRPLDMVLNPEDSPKDKQTWEIEVAALLARKHLNPDLFRRGRLTAHSKIEDHVRYLFENIYSIKYPGSTPIPEIEAYHIARFHYGITHVSRAAYYVTVMANLYRKHGDPQALLMTDDEVALLKIAVLLHDSAREDEGEDWWDHESGIFVYLYLTRTLGVDKKIAKSIAEAIANKDPHATKGYFEIIENDSGEVKWQFNQSTAEIPARQLLYINIIHDVDTLDVKRVHGAKFNGRYMNFYKNIASHPEKNLALDELSKLFVEVQSLIEIEGDSFGRANPKIKAKYESVDAYTLIGNDIKTDLHPMLAVFGKRLLSSSEIEELQKQRPFVKISHTAKESTGDIETDMQAAWQQGRLLARGIGAPSAMIGGKTQAEVELDKLFREKGIKTNSSKPDNMNKRGNLGRSVAMPFPGVSLYTNAGFLIKDPDHAAIRGVSSINLSTYRGKKKNIVKSPFLDNSEKELSNLIAKLKLGGDCYEESYIAKSKLGDDCYDASYEGETFRTNHVEILYDITRVDAIYFSTDPNFYNIHLLRNPYPEHKNCALLEAIFLRYEYKNKYQQTKHKFIATFGQQKGLKLFQDRFGDNDTLPVFEYSGVHGYMRRLPDEQLTDELIIKLWTEMCTEYIESEFKKVASRARIRSKTVYDIKTLSMFAHYTSNFTYQCGQVNAPADSNYPPDLLAKINGMVAKIIKKHVHADNEKITEMIQNQQLSILSDEAFFALVHDQNLLHRLKPDVQQQIETLLRGDIFTEANLLSFAIQDFNHLTENLFEPERAVDFDLGLLRVYLSSPDSPVEILKTNFTYLHESLTDKFRSAFFSTPAARLATLLREPAFAHYRPQLATKADKFVHRSLSFMRKMLSTFHPNMLQHVFVYLRNINYFLHMFELSEDSKQIIHNYIRDIFYHLFKHFECSDFNPEGILLPSNFCYELLNYYMQQPDWLNQKDIDYLRDIFSHPLNRISSEYHLNLNSYRRIIDIIKICQLIHLDVESDLIFFLKQTPTLVLRTDIIENQVFITLVTDSIRSSNADHEELILALLSKVYSEHQRPRVWLDTIKYIESRLDGGELQKSHEEELKRTWSVLCDRLLNSIVQRGAKDPCMLFIENLAGLTSDARFPIPNEILSKFDKYIMKLSSGEFIQPHSMDIQSLIDIHYSLPGKENRQEYIDKLTNQSQAKIAQTEVQPKSC